MMIKQQILSVIVLLLTTLTPAGKTARMVTQRGSSEVKVSEQVLAKQSLSLDVRARGKHINEVFKFNILLAVKKFGHGFTLQPGETFAFHENVLPKFRNSSLRTGWTKYEAGEGYQTVLGLAGNGVCHLASLMDWAASEAGLEVAAPVSHNFALVPGVPKKYGASIHYCPRGCNSANQNLYIRNNFDFPVKFTFETAKNNLSLTISRSWE